MRVSSSATGATVICGFLAVFVTVPLSSGYVYEQLVPAPAEQVTQGFGKGAYRVGNSSRLSISETVEPKYTKRALDAKLQGQVLLDVVIRPGRGVVEAHIIQSLDPDLDKEAIKAVKQWEFGTTAIAGKFVPFVASLTVGFKLPDQRPEAVSWSDVTAGAYKVNETGVVAPADLRPVCVERFNAHTKMIDSAGGISTNATASCESSGFAPVPTE